MGRARSQAARAKDPLVKLRALTVIARMQDAEDLFVQHAAAFSEAEGVTPDVWLELGVPAEALKRAGVTGSGRTRSTAKRATAKKATGGRKRKKAYRSERLTLEEATAKLPRKQFKVRDFAEVIERPVPTARNYLDRLVAAKAVKIVGEDNSGRGKPAKIYQRT